MMQGGVVVSIMALLCQWFILKCSCFSHQKIAVELKIASNVVTISNYFHNDS